MLLMNPDIAALLPPIGANENKKPTEILVPLKIFDPAGRLTLFVTEYDGDDTLYGYMISPLGTDCDEWGYASLAELQAVESRFGLGLERDIHWKPDTTLALLRTHLSPRGITP